MKRQFLLSAALTAALTAGFAFAPAFADDMKKEGIEFIKDDVRQNGKIG